MKKDNRSSCGTVYEDFTFIDGNFGCPTCFSLKDLKNCLKCDKKFKPMCNQRFVCDSCHMVNKNHSDQSNTLLFSKSKSAHRRRD